MKTGSKVVAGAGSLGTNAKSSAAPQKTDQRTGEIKGGEKIPLDRVKRPSKALKPKVGG
jgi:hypothetical protein